MMPLRNVLAIKLGGDGYICCHSELFCGWISGSRHPPLSSFPPRQHLSQLNTGPNRGRRRGSYILIAKVDDTSREMGEITFWLNSLQLCSGLTCHGVREMLPRLKSFELVTSTAAMWTETVWFPLTWKARQCLKSLKTLPQNSLKTLPKKSLKILP